MRLSKTPRAAIRGPSRAVGSSSLRTTTGFLVGCAGLAFVLLALVAQGAGGAGPDPAGAAPGDASSAGSERTPLVRELVRATAPRLVSKGATLFTLPWGDGPGQVGVTTEADSEGRGPECLAVAPDGRIAILDSLNSRLVLVDGSGVPAGVIPLDLRSPRFLAATNEAIHVLDADDDYLLSTFSWEGTQLSSSPAGPFPEPVTALLIDGDAPVIEVAHRGTLSPGRGVGQEDDGVTATEVTSGRPMPRQPGRRAHASLTPGRQPFVEDSDTSRGRHRGWDVDIGRGSKLDHLVSLDPDGSDGLILGMRIMGPPDRADLGRSERGELLLTKLGAIAPPLLLEERSSVYVGQPYVVGPDGRVYQPIAGADGYSVVIHTFEEAAR